MPPVKDAANSASNSCNSLAAIANASTLATTLSSEVILARNVLVDEWLAADGLQSVDVIGDGKCAFRSIAVCLTGTENSYLQLRRDIVRSMIRDSAGAVGKSSSTAADKVRDHLSNMSAMECGWVKMLFARLPRFLIAKFAFIQLQAKQGH